MPVLNDVVFAYAKIAQADTKYQSTEKEYSVDCVVPKAVAKEWNKKYGKQKAKEFDNADFERIFKIAPPFDGDEQFVIKLKKPAQYKDGTIIPDNLKPRVFEKGSDGKLVDITATKLVANGSKGVAQFDEVTNSFGTFAKLKAIRVDKLIEYKKGGSEAFSELGDVDGGLQDLSSVPERVPSEAQVKAQSKVVEQQQEPDFEDDLDESLPF